MFSDVTIANFIVVCLSSLLFFDSSVLIICTMVDGTPCVYGIVDIFRLITLFNKARRRLRDTCLNEAVHALENDISVKVG